MERRDKETTPHTVKLVRSKYIHAKPWEGIKFELVTDRSEYMELLMAKKDEELGEFDKALEAEVLDTRKISGEAADVLEVARTLGYLHRLITLEEESEIVDYVFRRTDALGINRRTIRRRQKSKRERLGGFSLGVKMLDYR